MCRCTVGTDGGNLGGVGWGVGNVFVRGAFRILLLRDFQLQKKGALSWALPEVEHLVTKIGQSGTLARW